MTAAIPALEALCRRFAGFGADRIVPEQAAAIDALAQIAGADAAEALARLIARRTVQGPCLQRAVAAAACLGAKLPAATVLELLRHDDPADSRGCVPVRPGLAGCGCAIARSAGRPSTAGANGGRVRSRAHGTQRGSPAPRPLSSGGTVGAAHRCRRSGRRRGVHHPARADRPHHACPLGGSARCPEFDRPSTRVENCCRNRCSLQQQVIHDTDPLRLRRLGARHCRRCAPARARGRGDQPGDRDAEWIEIHRHQDRRRLYGNTGQQGLGALYRMAVQ